MAITIAGALTMAATVFATALVSLKTEGSASIAATTDTASASDPVAVSSLPPPPPANILNAWSLGLLGTVPHIQSTRPTSNNPDGVVTWGGESDPGSKTGSPGVIVAASQFPSGKAMQFADGAGADFQFGTKRLNSVYVLLEFSFGSGANCPNTSGNFKFLRTRDQGYNNLNGSLIIQQGSLNYYGDNFGDGQMHAIVNNFAATYCDGRVHQLKFFINSPTAPGGSGLGYATIWIDGTLKGTGTSSTWKGAPAGTIAILQLFETINNPVGGVREVDRVSISDKDIPPLP